MALLKELEAGEPGHGVGEAGEGDHEGPGQGLHIAQGEVGAGVQLPVGVAEVVQETLPLVSKGGAQA